MTDASPICDLDQVTKRLGGREVLSDVDLSIGRGEMVAVTGPSGSGKSTLLGVVGLLSAADRGTLRLFGSPAPRAGSRAATMLLREKIGFLFQNFALVDTDTVDENLAIALEYAPRGMDRHRRTAEALGRVGLDGFGSRAVYSLSGGEQQRVAIARLLLKPCELVIADEPTGALDDDNRDAIVTLLRELRGSGKTILVATHDPAVSAACDRVLHLAAGQLSGELRGSVGEPR
jgi:putative ABC transport system ATP-binding protein